MQKKDGKIYTQESIEASRLELIRLFNTLQRQVCRVYRLSYEPLKDIIETSDEELDLFKLYSDRKIFKLLDSNKLAIDNIYANGTFDIRPRILDVKHYMTFDEFVDLNIRTKYPDATFIDRIYDEPEVIWSRFEDMIDKNLVTRWNIRLDGQMLDEFIRVVKQTVEALDDIRPKLQYLQFDIDEDFLFRRDEWANYAVDICTKVQNGDSNKISARNLKAKLKDSFIRLQRRSYRRYEFDGCDVAEICRQDSKYSKKIECLELDLFNLLSKFSLKSVLNQSDDDFYLTSSRLNVTKTTSFKQFIDEYIRSAYPDAKFLDKIREGSDSVWFDYVESCYNSGVVSADIEQEFDTIRDCISEVDSVIKDFDDFEKELRQLNDEFFDDCKELLDNVGACVDNDYDSRIRNLSAALKLEFNRLKLRLNSVYRVNYQSIERMKDLDATKFEHFKEDIDIEIISVLKRYALVKDKIYESSVSFELKPTTISIGRNTSLKRFVKSNLKKIHPDAMFIDEIYNISDESLIDKISKIAIDLVMTDYEIREEINVLVEFIELIELTNQAYDNFREELKELNAGLLEEYKSTYSDQSV